MSSDSRPAPPRSTHRAAEGAVLVPDVLAQHFQRDGVEQAAAAIDDGRAVAFLAGLKTHFEN